MTLISLTLPDSLAKQSQDIAKQMNVSRSHLIRIALEHEIEAFRIAQERRGLMTAFKNMKKNPNYLREADMWMDESNTELKNEPENWWKK